MRLPAPADLGLPRGAVVAIPADGLAVYRLIAGGTPTAADFRPQSPERARLAGWPEILRVGLSHFLTVEDARRARVRPGSSIAIVTLAHDVQIHVARTGRRPGHVTVWARPEELLSVARVVDA